MSQRGQQTNGAAGGVRHRWANRQVERAGARESISTEHHRRLKRQIDSPFQDSFAIGMSDPPPAALRVTAVNGAIRPNENGI
jgi:hypothetical protein